MNRFGEVSYFGVTREYRSHPSIRVSLVKGMPGYPRQLLKGTEPLSEVVKPWMVCRWNFRSGVVLTTSFFNTKAEAIQFIKVDPEIRAIVKTADKVKVEFDPLAVVPEVVAGYQRHIKLEE